MYTATEYVEIAQNLLPKPPSPNTQPEVRKLEPNHLYVYDLTEDKNYDLGLVTISNPSVRKDLLLSSTYQQSATAAANLVTPITAYNRLRTPNNFESTATNFKLHYSSIYIDGFQWYPNSTHILMTAKDRVEIIEFDSTNRATVYSGPFEQSFVYPWPDGSKLIILTNLNPATSAAINLYTVDIR
jgi:hypothetical protein